MRRSIEVPNMVQLKARYLGREGETWLASLPSIVSDVEEAWSIRVGCVMRGGTAALVTEVITPAHDAVLKLAPPDGGFRLQARTLRLADGHGYVRVLRDDAARRALLLERLGSSLDEMARPVEEQLDILGETLEAPWTVPKPPRNDRTTWLDKAASLRRYIESAFERLGRPLDEGAILQAFAFADRCRALEDAVRMVGVHGDPAPSNLRAVRHSRDGARTGFVFIDPDGFVGDPAYDLGVVLRGWCEELRAGQGRRLAEAYCKRLSRTSGLNEAAIWEWGYMERVSTGLYALDVGSPAVAEPYLRTAEMLS